MKPTMLVWLHGSEGWEAQWGNGFSERVTSAWEKEGCCSIFPAVAYETTAYLWDTGIAGETTRNLRDIQRNVEQARAERGTLPTAYVGISRGGFASVAAAQQDEHATFVLNICGSTIHEGMLTSHHAEQWRQEEKSYLARRAGQGPQGVWLYGGRDPYTSPSRARELFKSAGGHGKLVIADKAGHGWIDGWQKYLIEALLKAGKQNQ